KYILFDLDETLYSTETGLMAAIGQRILQYMQERVGLDPALARNLRRHYYQTYGATLKGLQIYHNVDPNDYLAYVHDVPLGDYLQPDEALDRALAGIQAEKIVFTNATTEHARRVLRFLGIEHHFNCIVDLRAMNYENKPQPEAYRCVLDTLGARPEECLLVEDSVRNLRPAKELGMVTVLVNGSEEDGVDFAIDDVAQVGEVLRRIQREGKR
ncbi:MAG TPA: pyrimidine 5'-nucleotidase, partial [Anaerolineae bacterium]|nr:pyrimidine 5'-nucleotidase [Anaerolineae bacterium]